MGRLQTLSAVALTALAVLAGCESSDENKAPLAPKERSQAVIAQPGSPAATPVTTASAVPSATARPSRARQLCSGHLSQTGKSLPKGDISRAQATGQPAVPEAIRVGSGWIWVNFWAAWCEPCKEEIPRLLEWQKKLTADGKAFRVVFVSLDDDSRQLQNFLNGQKADGLRATYWLQDGSERANWLKSVGLTDDPELPAHLLVDAKGEVRCRINGAIEDGDLSSLISLIQ